MTQEGIFANSSISNPVVRYAKNFTKFKNDFSLFIFSDETDMEKIESFFSSIVGKLKKTDISKAVTTASMSNFTYLENYYEGNK